MCDIRLFKSARLDFEAARMIWQAPFNDEHFLNIAAYHLQQSVEKVLKGALECAGVTVPNTHRITRLIRMAYDNGAGIEITDWIDEHSEMLSEWEAESRYNMDFLVEKRKLDAAMDHVSEFLELNGIQYKLRPELEDERIRECLLKLLPKSRRSCDEFELNCYYIMFRKKLRAE